MKQALAHLPHDLHNAIMKKNLEEVKLIIKQFQNHKISIDNASIHGVSPLFRAIQSGNIEIVRAVLNAGATIYTHIRDGRNPLDFAESEGKIEIHILLKEYKDNNILTSKNIESLEREILFIAPDGNCMYNAIIEGHRRLGLDNSPDLETLREMVHSRITHSRGDERNEYTDKIETQLINLIATFPRSIKTLEDLNDLPGFNLELYIIIQPYINLYNSGMSVLELMRQNGAVERYINTILSDGNWGGGVELWVMSRILGIEIIVHHSNGSPTIINNSGNQASPSIHLSLTGNHYNLITHTTNETPPDIIDDAATIETSTENEIIYLDDMPTEHNYMEILFITAFFIGCISLYDDGYFS